MHFKGSDIHGANVKKLFAAVIYHHSMIILSFCVIKISYFSNYLGIAVTYHGKKFRTLVHGGKHK